MSEETVLKDIDTKLGKMLALLEGAYIPYQDLIGPDSGGTAREASFRVNSVIDDDSARALEVRPDKWTLQTAWPYKREWETE